MILLKGRVLWQVHQKDIKESGCYFFLSEYYQHNGRHDHHLSSSSLTSSDHLIVWSSWWSRWKTNERPRMRLCLSCVRVTACASGASRCLDAERSTSRRRHTHLLKTSRQEAEYRVTRGRLPVPKLPRGRRTVGELIESAVRGFWRWEAGQRVERLPSQVGSWGILKSRLCELCLYIWWLYA